MNSEFYTFRGYQNTEKPQISVAMEDYLEMICRLIQKLDYVRINQLAALLNVKPSSASKMVNKLKENGMVEFEPYGTIRLTPEGKEMGDYLLRRHEVLNRFFCFLNQSESELELVEKIEHFMDRRTIRNIEDFLAK